MEIEKHTQAATYLEAQLDQLFVGTALQQFQWVNDHSRKKGPSIMYSNEVQIFFEREMKSKWVGQKLNKQLNPAA